MITKCILQRVLTAAVLVIVLGMESCVDNIDNNAKPSDNPQEQQAQAEQQAKAEKFWAVVSHLVDVDDYTDDYADMTFEPVYGLEGSEAGTRYVYTNDLATAAARFADLVEQEGIDETTEKYTYDDPDVGKLVYTKGSGRFLATVDVSIKQIPSLKKIVYVPGAYANGSFRGRAYYRFGDVVSRKNINYDNQEFTEYWICVRPSFGPESKGDSHWVCLSELPKNNVWHYHSDTNDLDYWLPTGLGTNEEHMQNLAEMLFAIYFPEEWEENVTDYCNSKHGLKMFHDFDPGKIEYHNQHFWKNVQNEWRDKNILENVLHYHQGEDAFRQMLKGAGLHLFYKGYSWWTKTSWTCTVYEANYKDGGDYNPNKEKNMHRAILKAYPHDMQEKGIDCRKMGPETWNNYKAYVYGDQPRWTIRHATGKELMLQGSKYDKQEPIDGVKEVYRYYHHVKPTTNYRDEEPEKTEEGVVVEHAEAGCGTYMIGDVVKDKYGNRWFCLNGSPACSLLPGSKDSLATFISFDFYEVNTKGNTIPGLPTAEEIPELAYRLDVFSYLIYTTLGYKANDLGPIGRHILKYANVSLDKILTVVDSTLTFTAKGSKWNSRSDAIIINFAYNDGSIYRQAVCRAIFDNTQSGSQRSDCVGISGKTYNYFRYLAYLHYLTFDVTKMKEATDDVKGLGIPDWCRNWPLTDEKMYLQDMADQDMVNRYAKYDKWATLPLAVGAGAPGPRRQARTQAEQSAKPSEYIGRYGSDDTPKTNMFNEPVCFFRVMKVKDTGGKKANLVSTDGRKLSIVHLQNNADAYAGHSQCSWANHYCSNASKSFFLDDKPYPIPLIEGLEYMDVESEPNFIE